MIKQCHLNRIANSDRLWQSNSVAWQWTEHFTFFFKHLHFPVQRGGLQLQGNDIRSLVDILADAAWRVMIFGSSVSGMLAAASKRASGGALARTVTG